MSGSVELWGDPHVVLNFGGEETKFDIGYGPGAVELTDGTVIRWDTFPPGHERQFVLKEFTVDSAGEEFDHTVKTKDGKDESGLQTALTDAQLAEFGDALRQYEGPMSEPLTLKEPTQS